MVIGEFLRRLQESLRAEQESIQERMGSGGCSDFNDYSRNVGMIAGVDLAIATIQETVETLNEEDQE
jgi:hypothetical protein